MDFLTKLIKFFKSFDITDYIIMALLLLFFILMDKKASGDPRFIPNLVIVLFCYPIGRIIGRVFRGVNWYGE